MPETAQVADLRAGLDPGGDWLVIASRGPPVDMHLLNCSCEEGLSKY